MEVCEKRPGRHGSCIKNIKRAAVLLLSAVMTVQMPLEAYAAETVSSVSVPEVQNEMISDDSVSADTVSGERLPGNTVSEPSVSENIWQSGDGWLAEATVSSDAQELSDAAEFAEASAGSSVTIPADGKIPDGFTSEEWQVLLAVNKERHAMGLQPLAGFAAFQKVADIRAEEISRSFSHTRPDGSNWFTAFTGIGSYTYAGENIAAGYSSPEAVMTAWMNSSGHKANILTKNFTRIAVGYLQSSAGNYGTYWVQNFIGTDTSAQTACISQTERKISVGGSLSGLGINIALVYGSTTAYLRLEDYMCSGFNNKVPGRYAVSVNIQGCKTTFPLLVNQAPTSVSVSGDRVANRTVSMEKDETAQLYATVMPADANYKTDIHWSSSDAKVADVDQNGLVKSLAYGTAVITAKTGNGKSCSVKIYVRDIYGPHIDTAKIMLNTHQSISANVDIVPVTSASIDAVELVEPQGLDYLADTLTRGDGYSWSLTPRGTCDRSYCEKCIIRTHISRTSQSGQYISTVYDRAVTVQYVTALPKVSFSQLQKANLFYTDAKAVFRVTCAADIDDITAEEAAAKGYSVSYDAARRLVTLNAVGLNAQTVDEKGCFSNAMVKLRVRYADYGSAEYTVKCASVMKPVRLAAEAAVIYPGSDACSGQLINKAAGLDYFSDTVKITQTDSGKVKLVDTGRGGYILKCGSGVNSGSVQASITDSAWTKPVVLKITVKREKFPKKITPANNVIIMNTAAGVSDNSYTIPMKIKGSSLKLSAVKADNAEELNASGKLAGALSVSFDSASQKLLVALDPSKAAAVSRQGSYRLRLTGKTEAFEGYADGVPVTASLTVRLLTQAPSVSVRTSGRINLTARKDTCVKLMTSCRNVPEGTEVLKAEIAGVYKYNKDTRAYDINITDQAPFSVSRVSDGEFELAAVSGNKLDTVNYRIVLKTLLNDPAGTEVSTAAAIIKPENHPAKLRSGCTSMTLYTASELPRTYDIISTGLRGQSVIDSAELRDSRLPGGASSVSAFKYTMGQNGKGSIAIRDASLVKPGKSYTLTFNVSFRDQAESAKPMAMKLKVTVR